MDIEYIKNLLSTEEISSQDDYQVMEVLVAEMLKIYSLSGLSRNYNATQLKEEVGIYSNELLKDLRQETKFDNLRIQEIGYSFSCGLRGDYDVKTFGINYQTFYKWIEAYAYSQERIDARNSLVRAKGLKQLNITTAPTLEEQKRMIIDHINKSYADYKGKSKLSMHIGNKIGEVMDFGEVKERFLTNEGIKPKAMSLREFYDKCIEEGKEVIIETK